MVPLPRKIALAVAGLGVVAAGAWYARTPRVPVHPIDAVPADAFVAIELNVGALRQSGALAALFGDRDEQSLTAVCGFDPVDQMDDLVFTVPEDSNGIFGVAVGAKLTETQLIGCANEVVKAHGGDPTSDVTERGGYKIITPQRVSADATKPGRSLGYSAGNPILVGPKTWLSSMVDAVTEAGDAHAVPSEHVRLRASLAKGITPLPTFVLTATVLLQRSVRDKLKAEMLAEVGGGDDPGSAMMIGVLGMSSGVLGLYESGSNVHAKIELHCEHEAECAQVEKLIMKVKDDWSRIPSLKVLGVTPVLERLAVSHSGTVLELRTSAATADILRWGKLFLASRPLLTTPADDSTRAAALWPKPAPAVLSGGAPDVPTQTLHVEVPEGVAPGQPFTVKVPVQTSGAASGSVHLEAIPGPPGAAPAHP